jgi:prolyl 4-hydroxylase
MKKKNLLKWVGLLFFVLLTAGIIYYVHARLTRAVPVENIHISNPAYSFQEIDDYLSPMECDAIMRLASPKLEPSLVYNDGKKDAVDKTNRQSDQAWLKNEVHPLVLKISKLVAETSGYPMENQEDLQVVKYEPGGFFNPHYDACEGDKTFCERMDGKSGPRMWTYIIYLNEDFNKGETIFPKLNKKVIPKKGKVLIFQSTDDASGKLIFESLHGGEPVENGNKWICNKWIRSHKFIA